MTDLVAFLNARLADDEQAARSALEPSEMRPYGDERIPPITSEQVPDEVRNYLGGTWGEHFARHDPARVLADVQAKRAILALYAKRYAAADQDVPNPPKFSPYNTGVVSGLNRALRLLASAYADHPDYQPGWAVGACV